MILKYYDFINENLQLADKYIFDKNLISEEKKEYLLNICLDKKFFFILSQIYIYKDKYYIRDIQKVYEEIVNYNKKFIDIGLDIYKNYSEQEIGKLIESLKNVNRIKVIFQELPSIALRNLKHELKTLNTSWYIKSYLDKLEYFQYHYSLLSNKDSLYKKKIEQKMFKNNVTVNDLIDFAEDKSNLFLDTKISKKEIIDIVEESQKSGDDLNIVYEKDNILIIEVSSAYGIRKIGKYSLWCFTYGETVNYRQWQEYSYDGIIYIIFDFSCNVCNPYFSFVLIKPLKMNNPSDSDFSLWNNYNEPVEHSPKKLLSDLIGSVKEVNKIFTFKSVNNDFY